MTDEQAVKLVLAVLNEGRPPNDLWTATDLYRPASHFSVITIIKALGLLGEKK